MTNGGTENEEYDRRENGGRNGRKKTEIAVFLFLAVFLAPFLAVAGIGGYGLLIWLLQ